MSKLEEDLQEFIKEYKKLLKEFQKAPKLPMDAIIEAAKEVIEKNKTRNWRDDE
jgi:ribosomal protein L39E